MKHRGGRFLERLIERAIAASAFLAVLAVVLVFVFVAREVLPILVGSSDERSLVHTILGKSGDDGSYSWQPVGKHPKLDVVPLLVGSLKVTTLAMLFGVPLAMAAALAVTEVFSERARRLVSPAIELFAGVPSVVLGVVALTFVAPTIQRALGTAYASNALVAALALSLAVVPVVFAVMVEAFAGVPRDLREASYALGARRWQTALLVVVPASTPGVVAALALGFGRAIGETMIVLMTSGNAAVADLSPTSGARTITATIAAELGETERGGEHWRVLFLLGLVLMIFTFVLDWGGRTLASRLARRSAPRSPSKTPAEAKAT